MARKQIRLMMLGFVTLVMIIVMVFLWAININQPDALRQTLNTYLLILGGFALVSLALFFLKAELYDEKGRLEKGRILTMTTVVLIIVQLTFAFADYAYKKLEFTFNGIDHAKALFTELKGDSEVNRSILLKDGARVSRMLNSYTGAYREIDSILIVDGNDVVIYSNDESLVGSTILPDPLSYYSFHLDTGALRMHISEEFNSSMTRRILTELLTVMAVSVFLTIELMLFVLKLINNRIDPPGLINGRPYNQALCYVRQIAFLFYFASRMASSFIPVSALNFGGSLFGITGNVLAGIPQSAEIFFTCAAIFLTSMLIERKGWKLPFTAGLLMVAAGTFLSAFSPDIILFILSRAIAGLGYGFCWMTLRNFALFGRNENEKAEGFSLLNAGIYAGINCGSVFGSILAEKLGYTTVFLLAAGFTILCSLMVIRLENTIYVRPDLSSESGSGNEAGFSGWALILLFIVLMITPSCIAGSYLSYYLPIYFTDTGHGVSDVGRAQLLYGLMIIYIGPYLSRMIANFPALGAWNLAYNIMLGITLITAGLAGGFIPAISAVMLIGFSDSFGFVAQNNYFLKFRVVQRLGESRSLSYLSFIKKMAEMLGPIVFGFAAGGVQTSGIMIIGVIFVAGALFYMAVSGRRDLKPEKAG